VEGGDGPVSELLRVHKALRVELHALLRRAKEIPVDGSVPNPRSLASLAESVALWHQGVNECTLVIFARPLIGDTANSGGVEPAIHLCQVSINRSLCSTEVALLPSDIALGDMLDGCAELGQLWRIGEQKMKKGK